MANNEEVTDVEEFRRDRQCNSVASLKRRSQKLQEENSALDTKLRNTSFANDKLHRQLFELQQQQHRVAQLLGFDSLISAEANITAKDPWVPGAQKRILFLEVELAKHVDAEKEAQEKFIELDLSLAEAQNEALRLRELRDSARQEAEKHAADCLMFRGKLQTCLNELRKCREELQRCRDEEKIWMKEAKKKAAPPSSPAKAEEELCKAKERCPNPLRDVANTCSFNTRSQQDSQAQYGKEPYELLEAKYNKLLESKRKVSEKYFKDLQKWKNFKEWLIKEPQTGNSKRRAIRRRKAMEDIGPRDDPFVSHLEDSVILSPMKDKALGGSDITFPDQTHRPKNGFDADLHARTVLSIKDPSHTLSPLKLRVSSPSPASQAESMTQMSSMPPAAPENPSLSPIPKNPSTSGLPEQPSLSQESITQPSSTPQSPVDGPSVIHEECAHSQLYSTKIPSDKDPVVTEDSEKPPRFTDVFAPVYNERILTPRDAPKNTMKTQEDNPTSTSVNFRKDKDIVASKMPAVSSHVSDFFQSLPSNPSYRYRRREVQRESQKDDVKQVPGSGIRRASTVLAVDTPPRASVPVRHHSSPPDSPHVPPLTSSSSSSVIMSKRKRNIADIEDHDGADQGVDSDPFVVGPSKSPAKLTTTRTREQQAAHLKVLGKQSHKQYMAEYMQYKGRGRYSNVKGLSDATVNAKFEIDPARNGGLDYQFDAVVRDKAGRKNLEAGDCECCREYYEAVGPLPPRLQPPKWKSPRSQEGHASRPCRHEDRDIGFDAFLTPSATARAKAIKLHKDDISRHRHDWAPPTTPPSYWQIGFPNTQEVEDINRQANDMHARKLQRVEADVSSNNGRYKRRE